MIREATIQTPPDSSQTRAGWRGSHSGPGGREARKPPPSEWLPGMGGKGGTEGNREQREGPLWRRWMGCDGSARRAPVTGLHHRSAGKKRVFSRLVL
jgi:hypothetical protein